MGSNYCLICGHNCDCPATARPSQWLAILTLTVPLAEAAYLDTLPSPALP